MGKSHQAGWVVLRGKRWYGYFRRRVIDPKQNEEEVETVCVRLDLKAQMTKFEARDALRAEITKQTGQKLAGSRILKDSSVYLRMVRSQPLFPAARGRVAAGNGEDQEDPDRTGSVGEVRESSARHDGQIHAANAPEQSRNPVVTGSRQACAFVSEIDLR